MGKSQFAWIVRGERLGEGFGITKSLWDVISSAIEDLSYFWTIDQGKQEKDFLKTCQALDILEVCMDCKSFLMEKETFIKELKRVIKQKQSIKGLSLIHI